VRLPSLYNYIDGLAGLQRELGLLAARELAERMSRAAIGKSGDDAVLALAQAYRAYILAHPGRYGALVRAPAADDLDMQALSTAIIEIVLAVLQPYKLGKTGAIHAVRGLRSIVHGFATLEQAGGFGLPLDCDESFRLLLQAYVVGLQKASGDQAAD
jgi:hypothetical protein